jgi:PAS domain S-box-containing protein
MMDVTETREAQRRLGEAEQRFRTLVEQIPAVTFADDDTPEHDGIYVSPQIRDLIGVDADAAMSDPDLFRRHMHPDDEARVWTAWDHALESGGAFEAEYRVLHADGRARWVWERSTILRSAGRPSFRECSST